MVKAGWKMDGRWLVGLNCLSNLSQIEFCERNCLIYMALFKLFLSGINTKYMAIEKLKPISLCAKMTSLKTFTAFGSMYELK